MARVQEYTTRLTSLAELGAIYGIEAGEAPEEACVGWFAHPCCFLARVSPYGEDAGADEQTSQHSRSRHCRASTLNSISAMFSRLPCLGV